jgi:hypothetical protein
MSTENGTESAISPNNESSVDTSMSQSNQTNEYSSAATTQFMTESSSAASSESGLVMGGGGPMLPDVGSWAVPSSKAAAKQGHAPAQPARSIHAVVKYYKW